MAVHGIIDCGNQVVCVLVQVSDLTARPQGARATQILLGSFGGYFANCFSLMGS